MFERALLGPQQMHLCLHEKWCNSCQVHGLRETHYLGSNPGLLCDLEQITKPICALVFYL